MEQRLPAGAAGAKGSRTKRQSAFARTAIIEESGVFDGITTGIPFGPERAWRADNPPVRRSREAPRESAVLGCDMPENDERADYLRATLARGPDGTLVATPIKIQDSSMMAALAKADCLVVREAFAPAAKAGSRCVILRLTRPF